MTNTTPTRDEMMARLLNVQNHPANVNQDIITITACRPVMTDAELLRHLTFYEERAAKYVNPKASRKREGRRRYQAELARFNNIVRNTQVA